MHCISIYTEGVRNNRRRLFDSPPGGGGRGGRKLSSNGEGTHGVRVCGGGGTIFLLILRECKTGFYGPAECAINEAVYPSV